MLVAEAVAGFMCYQNAGRQHRATKLFVSGAAKSSVQRLSVFSSRNLFSADLSAKKILTDSTRLEHEHKVIFNRLESAPVSKCAHSSQ
jgi:hypothetical protein